MLLQQVFCVSGILGNVGGILGKVGGILGNVGGILGKVWEGEHLG